MRRKGSKRLRNLLALLIAVFGLRSTGHVKAQDHTVLFSTSDAGVGKAITNWGLDTTEMDSDNIQRGLIFMGSTNVNVAQVGFEMQAALTNNDITASQKTDLQNMANLALMVPNACWNLSCATGAGVTNWYQSGTGTVHTDRWEAAMSAWKRDYNAYNTNWWMVQGFNEPDYCCWGEGTMQDLSGIFWLAQADTNFTGTTFAGGCTLNCDNANAWYDAISNRVSVGTTHCIVGSVAGYVGFIQNVLANHAMPFDPEVHNLGEVIMGANYGLQGGIWWGTAELARGSFVQACQGRRLGYADDFAKWTSAAVYRAPSGAVQAFLGGSERVGTNTSYRFFCQDRDVFYDGNGPQRDYTVTNTGPLERVVNITWGGDVPQAINGRYLIMNRTNLEMMAVATTSTNPGVNVVQYPFQSGASNQRWDVIPDSTTNGGDQSYYTITNVNSGLVLDLDNFSYSDGGGVQQWTSTGNPNQQWYFEYATNGFFYIHSRWDAKVLQVGSITNGASVQQSTKLNGANQQWRLIPVNPTNNAVTLIAPPAPTGVTASANPVSVQLNWTANTQSSLEGYTVLRGTNAGGPYQVVARGLPTNSFTDKSANQPLTYYYVVRAVDIWLNASGNSAEVNATPSCAPTLVAQYPFNGNAADSSINANNATLSGSPAFGGGKFGGALYLNGTNQYAMAPAGVMASVTNFTVAAWVYWNGGALWQRIFDFGNGTNQYMFLTPNSASGTLRFAITTNGSPGEQIVETTALATGSWRHVAVTFNGSTISLYTNGLLAASGAGNIPPSSFNPALNNLGESQYPGDPFLTGAINDFRIYNYQLSASQVITLATNAPPALEVYLPFDEGSGTTAVDATGNGLNGTLVNGATCASGYSSNAVSLNGTNQYVSLPSGVVSSLSDFSIAAWVNLNSAPTWSRIFDFGSGTGSYIFLTPQAFNAGLRFAITTNSNAGEQQINYNSVLPTNGWHHVAVTLTGGTAILYLDGKGVATNSTMTLNPSNLGYSTQDWIGRSQWSADPYLNGRVDEFRIYGVGLSAGDVATFVTPLGGPTGLTAAGGNMQVSLSWNASANASSYNVLRSLVNGGPYTQIVDIASTAFTDTGLTNGVTYYYVVQAVNTVGQSGNSLQVSATPLSAFESWQMNYFDSTNCPTCGPDADFDGVGVSNTNKFLAGFNPTNSAAYLHIISIATTNNSADVDVTYLGANGDTTYTGGPSSRTNVLEFTTGTTDGSYSNAFASTGQTNILSGGNGLGVVTNMVDSGGATNNPARYYRVRVLLP